ncbi:energy-coupling factor transport system permease protein [Terribacillus halophilus]|uniref:Energy-coupling factor transporter transmembrane protein EcfT n=1 Tax=Terribacillus halophilus TaxID=361279 RepID=A0A1G6VW63_9BACI|nr:energy-coupling factor transporter transmembrane protein EcfT [Terribacillus halophilus]SDD57811.1 energy-coupling factor transport system permease protein [Terribacillus halophilus]
MNNLLIIGQYVPTNSIVHRMDPRIKMLIIFFYVIFIFFANNVFSYALFTVFAIGGTLLTKVPWRFIAKGLTPVWFLIVFTFILHLFVTKEGTVLVNIFGLPIYSGALEQGAVISLRFFLLILLTSLLTLTTTPIEITDGVESLLGPLRRFKFPVHELALMMSISLRFIPTLLQETEKISNAQASRGVDFRTGPFRERVRAVIPLLVPLFVSAFKRAEELAMAMEARGYRGGEGRTKLRELRVMKRDVAALILFIVVVAAALITRDYS